MPYSRADFSYAGRHIKNHLAGEGRTLQHAEDSSRALQPSSAAAP